MNLKTVKFEKIKNLEDEIPYLTKKYANIDYDYDGNKIPLELVLSEFHESVDYNAGFVLNVHQGSTNFEVGPKDTLDEILDLAQGEIDQAYEMGYLESEDTMYLDYEV